MAAATVDSTTTYDLGFALCTKVVLSSLTADQLENVSYTGPKGVAPFAVWCMQTGTATDVINGVHTVASDSLTTPSVGLTVIAETGATLTGGKLAVYVLHLPVASQDGTSLNNF